MVIAQEPATGPKLDGADTEGSPDVVILQQMREPEQRVTALLNGEVQMARYVPPQLVRRLEGRKDVKIQKTGGIEVMFVAFNNKMAPWTDVRLRKAVAHAINRHAHRGAAARRLRARAGRHHRSEPVLLHRQA